MEIYVNTNDITYPERSFSMKNNLGTPKLFLKSHCIRGMSELILDVKDVKDLIRTYNLRALCARKLCAH